MKGVVLAGGLGSRLRPLTAVTNKHLLPVFNQPMIYYPIQLLVSAGIDRILIVTGGNHAGEFLPLLGNGSAFGLKHLDYTHQERPAGIADALGLARYFAADDSVAVVLGDNIFEFSIRPAVERFRAQIMKDGLHHPVGDEPPIPLVRVDMPCRDRAFASSTPTELSEAFEERIARANYLLEETALVGKSLQFLNRGAFDRPALHRWAISATGSGLFAPFAATRFVTRR